MELAKAISITPMATQRAFFASTARMPMQTGGSGSNLIRGSGTCSPREPLLDAGCGPGNWLRRLVTRARVLGFSSVTARGFDVSQAQIEVAHRMASDLFGQAGVILTFDVASLTGPLPEADSSIDLTLCLYSVLNHLPTSTLPQIAAELDRVTRGHFVATVRSAGSTPTAFVDTIETARNFELDHERDQFRIEFNRGQRMALQFHLFTPGEPRHCFANQFDIEDFADL
jgi:SAM-dependent methyltransferase